MISHGELTSTRQTARRVSDGPRAPHTLTVVGSVIRDVTLEQLGGKVAGGSKIPERGPRGEI